MTKRPPFIFRLMLCTMFLPIMLLLAVAWYFLLFHAPEGGGLWIDHSTMLGVYTTWIGLSLMAFPFVLFLWILWSGNWRRPVLTAALVYGAAFVIGAFGIVEMHTSPEKRMIHLRGIAGTDVYCNGVHLGQLPLRIRVDELMEKVPEWTTPPEQRWYRNSGMDQQGLTTWIPWDNFIKERFEASRELFGADGNRNVASTPRAIRERLEALNRHDASCRYWWSFRFGDTQMVFHRTGSSGYLNRPFEKQSSYYPMITPFSPSIGFHAQLLADVLPELTPEQKADWDQHVLKHWSLLGGSLRLALHQTATRHQRDKNEPLAELYENALHSTARMKYNLSDPPTEEECRRLLANWVEESIDGSRSFHFSWDYEGSFQVRTPTTNVNVLIPADITETMRKPLVEQWRRDKYRYENGWAPVAYFSALDKSPDYFSDFVRFFATTHKARFEVLENEAPGTVALFNTLLKRRNLYEIFAWNIYIYPNQIRSYSRVNNPLTETVFREYIVHTLSDPNHTDSSRSNLEGVVVNAIWQRIDWKDIDRDEFAAWVASLPIPASSKSLALRMIRLRSGDALSFADQLQRVAGRGVLIETALTLDDITQWFADNPEGILAQFLGEQEENITVREMSDRRLGREVFSSSDPFDFIDGAVVSQRNDGRWDGGLQNLFMRALLQSDTPEGDPQVRELIRQIWLRDSATAERAIETVYGMPNFQRRSEFATDVGSVYLPEYILDLYLSPENAAGAELSSHNNMWIGLAPILALCDSPKAGEILERWIDQAPSAMVRLRVERNLEIWRTRNTLRQMKMEVFQDLVAGRMSPDELLLPQPPWVWVDGEYVQTER